ncbi:MAG: hypothetical protein ABI693_01795 [Bryobacteraceae bacterium]
METRFVCGVLLCLLTVPAIASEPDTYNQLPVSPLVKPILPLAATVPPPEKVEWKPLIAQSLRFLFLEHAFRYATEEGTRSPGQPFFQGYANSVSNLHGWADGDSFIVNYVGHPMQGALAGYLWVQNDGRYRRSEFGRNREYWKSRLRAAAFASVYSFQFELGPLSEASLGNVQSFFPQQGFVDHVVTPAVGLGWMVAEDAVDNIIIRRLETRIDNPYYKLLIRTGLNPSRTMANVFAGRVPWYRATRQGAFTPGYRMPAPVAELGFKREYPAQPALTFTVAPRILIPLGGNGAEPCIGGGATAAAHIRDEFQWIFDVGGCSRTGLGANLSGDNITFMTGPRWNASTGGTWNRYVQILAGGMKATTEEFFPARKAALEAEAKQQGKTLTFADHHSYTNQDNTAGFAVSVGAGIERKLNSALALRVASLDYTHAWTSRLDGVNVGSNLQFTTGLILRLGTW